MAAVRDIGFDVTVILHPGTLFYVLNIVLNFKSIGLVPSVILGLSCVSILV